jgi:hypothetical protein
MSDSTYDPDKDLGPPIPPIDPHRIFIPPTHAPIGQAPPHARPYSSG